jgi:hypothetical protein
MGWPDPNRQIVLLRKDGEPSIVVSAAVPGQRRPILVDGAAFRTGANGLHERFIRERLVEATSSQRVERFRESDLRDDRILVRRLLF